MSAKIKSLITSLAGPDFFNSMRVTTVMLFILFIPSLFYVLRPLESFPAPPPDSLRSKEPADIEDPLRRAYFTDFTREEVISHYDSELGYFPNIRLNYPPEEAQIVIKEQTRSTFLEELVNPLRESFYINGFKPRVAKDAINIEGRNFRQKITVRHVPSSLFVRVIVVSGIFVSLWLVLRYSILFFIDVKKTFPFYNNS